MIEVKAEVQQRWKGQKHALNSSVRCALSSWSLLGRPLIERLTWVITTFNWARTVLLMNEWMNCIYLRGKKGGKKLSNSAGFKCLMFPLEAVWGGNGPQVRMHLTQGTDGHKALIGRCDHERANPLIEPSHKKPSRVISVDGGAQEAQGLQTEPEQSSAALPVIKRCRGWSLAQQQQCTDKHSNISRDVNQDITLSRHPPSSTNWLRQRVASSASCSEVSSFSKSDFILWAASPRPKLGVFKLGDGKLHEKTELT